MPAFTLGNIRSFCKKYKENSMSEIWSDMLFEMDNEIFQYTVLEFLDALRGQVEDGSLTIGEITRIGKYFPELTK